VRESRAHVLQFLDKTVFPVLWRHVHGLGRHQLPLLSPPPLLLLPLSLLCRRVGGRGSPRYGRVGEHSSSVCFFFFFFVWVK